MIDDTLFEAEEKMESTVSVAQNELASIRTGRANPNMFSRIVVEYYGAMTPLNQLASIAIPEARMAVVKPFDASQLGPIEKAIRDSDLGVNPSNDGTIIRIVIPQLSEERRRDMVKIARGKGEDAKVSIRGVRRKAKDELDRLVKDGESGEDDVTRAEKELQNLTDKYVAQIDEIVKRKEADLLEV
ncbi:Ribosome recycling factor [Actinokineospora spheciospongiae]|uniref:Ribosome-recycling factor n=1 Tax=Actinokineospora spheciospongiae TaxID=909613 RepID=W7IQF8_9PSEU|nr:MULTISPECIES: ribosome recycling factor [Actinokineospora]EWC62623.1 Ribosome recycling factor [Actinokineospora spheciospongiae]MCG8918291.1 ribosome recycling factor [Actinokineospora sp. PR83]PWW54228.1 ribosome recycling factor [Actinokineospora spheciospongiae]